MSRPLPPSPHLPTPPAQMDARALTAHGEDRGAGFYLTALTYAHHLWQRGLAARAVLSLDRALGADLRGEEPVLREWPLPYAAQAWFLRHAPADVFIGNPRVHFQHLADRMNEPRREQRRWRIWACWAICRVVRPEFPSDPKHGVTEPDRSEIARRLELHGIPGEAPFWISVMEGCLNGPEK
ncbi:MAG: hypothetical protein QG602_2238 [Verrucomicrobiota bacterium]|nr:hypothetical protein [Verrucomicrobiota bacterium]